MRLQAYGGMDYDSNVTLDNGSTPRISVAPGRRRRRLWRGDLRRRPRRRALHADARRALRPARLPPARRLGTMRTFRGFCQRGGSSASAGSPVRASESAPTSMLGDSSYLTQGAGSARPASGSAQRLGVVQLAANVEGDDYDDKPLFPSLERDGFGYGGGLRQFVPIPGYPGARGSGASGAGTATRPGAHRDALGFDGDFDRDNYSGGVHVDVPLFWSVSAELGPGCHGRGLRERQPDGLPLPALRRGRGTSDAAAARQAVRDRASRSSARSSSTSTSSCGWRYQDRRLEHPGLRLRPRHRRRDDPRHGVSDPALVQRRRS